MIEVALVDDFAVTRKGIRVLLEMHPSIRVTIETDNGLDLIDQLSRHSLPHIVIMDIRMPQMNGFETIAVLKQKFPSIRSIVLSQINDEDAIIHMMSCGARGYLHKSTDPLKLSQAVLEVEAKGFYASGIFSEETVRTMTHMPIKSGFTGKEKLTPKEVDLIRLSASNLTYNQIADLMFVSPKTVHNYRDHLFTKLHIHNRSALTLYGIKTGIVNID